MQNTLITYMKANISLSICSPTGKTIYNSKEFSNIFDLKDLKLTNQIYFLPTSLRLALVNNLFDNDLINDVYELKKDNNTYFIDTTIIRNNDENFIILRKDITKLISSTKIDFLTKLGNINLLKNELKAIPNTSHILATIDINKFTHINELYGHDFGDKVLIYISKELSLVYNEFKVYRLHSDKFALLKKLDENEMQNKEIITKKLKSNLQNIFDKNLTIEGKAFVVNVTAGISVHNNVDIIKYSEYALKLAKDNNLKSYYLNDIKESKINKKNNAEIINLLVDSINNGDLALVYQPIIDNNTREIAKYEVLVRLKKDNLLLSPNLFLDISKKIKMYNCLTKQVIKKAFNKFNNTNFSFSINISLEDIAHLKTRNTIIESIRSFSNPSNITLEIVESSLINDFNLFNDFADEIHSLGAKISIDDFGTGYANLSYLTKIKFDYLKIDGTLITSIAHCQDDYELLNTIIKFTKKLNIKTVAEFVETEEIFSLIKKIGIDYSQGYLFSKPITDNQLNINKGKES